MREPDSRRKHAEDKVGHRRGIGWRATGSVCNVRAGGGVTGQGPGHSSALGTRLEGRTREVRHPGKSQTRSESGDQTECFRAGWNGCRFSQKGAHAAQWVQRPEASAEKAVLMLQTSPGGRGVRGLGSCRAWQRKPTGRAGEAGTRGVQECMPGGKAGACWNWGKLVSFANRIRSKPAAEHAGSAARAGGLCTSSRWPPR